MNEFTLNFSDARAQADLFSALRQLRGPYRITVVRHKPRRSDPQNRYYWPCVVHQLGQHLRQQDGSITDDFCHQMLRMKFLTVSVVNQATGEVVGQRVRSTTELTIEEFGEYLENCIAYAAEMFHVVCPDPALYSGTMKGVA